MDIYDKFEDERSSLKQYQQFGHGYYTFPILKGPIGNKMQFRGREVLVWSINNYLGLANNPEIRKADADAAEKWGLGYPMGARIMSGQTELHYELEEKLAKFENKESAYLLNYGYQGMFSIIQTLLNRKDVVIFDSESHACIIDGVWLHKATSGRSFVYPHNNIENLEKQLQRATKLAQKSGGGILVVTEGVFGMAGDLGKLKDIVALKEKYNFRLLVDDAHGFGTMGETGAGTGEFFGVQDGIDLYFGTFAKAMAGIGGFVAGEKKAVDYLRYAMRSQIFAKSLPMPMVEGALKRLEMLQTRSEFKNNLWKIVNSLQKGLKDKGFDLGDTESPVTPVYFSGGLPEATTVLLDLREEFDIFCSVVVYPVVPKDVILLRLIPTAVHTMDDVNYTIDAYEKIRKNFEQGKYNAEVIPTITEQKNGRLKYEFKK